jgi:hypothetical protein
VKQDGCKLFATIACDKVGYSGVVCQSLTNAFQNFIAGHVSEGVVDRLEEVNIDQSQSEWANVSLDKRDFGAEPLKETVAVLETSKDIGICHSTQLSVHDFQFTLAHL